MFAAWIFIVGFTWGLLVGVIATVAFLLPEEDETDD